MSQAYSPKPQGLIGNSYSSSSSSFAPNAVSYSAKSNPQIPRSPRGRGIGGTSSFGVDILSAASENNTYCIDLEKDSAQYLSITDANQTGLDLSTTATISLWMNLESHPTGTNAYSLVEKDDNVSGQRSYFLQYGSWTSAPVKRFWAAVFNGANYDLAYWAINTSVILNHWVHVSLTIDTTKASATTFELYINGISQGNGNLTNANNISSISNTTANFTIGSKSQGAQYLDSRIDEVKVFNTVRTAAQILADMRQSTSGVASLVGHWKLNNDLTDSSGNGNTLTNNGTATFVTTVPFSSYGTTNRFYADSGDGFVGHVQQTNSFSTARNATDGNEADYTSAFGTASIEKGATPLLKWTIRRAFLPIDTSSLSSDPLEAFISVYATTGQNNSNSSYLTLAQASQNSGTELLTSDYDNLGTVDGMTRLYLTFGESGTNVANAYVYWKLTQLDWINRSGYTKLAFRISGDMDNSAPTLPALNEDIFGFATNETAGATIDPYIDITT